MNNSRTTYSGRYRLWSCVRALAAHTQRVLLSHSQLPPHTIAMPVRCLARCYAFYFESNNKQTNKMSSALQEELLAPRKLRHVKVHIQRGIELPLHSTDTPAASQARASGPCTNKSTQTTCILPSPVQNRATSTCYTEPFGLKCVRTFFARSAVVRVIVAWNRDNHLEQIYFSRDHKFICIVFWRSFFIGTYHVDESMQSRLNWTWDQFLYVSWIC